MMCLLRWDYGSLIPYEEESDRLSSQIIKEYSDGNLICKMESHLKDKDAFYDDFLKIRK